MGDGCGIKHKEWFILIVFKKLKSLFMNNIWRILSGLAATVSFQNYFILIVPQMVGVIVVCQSLTVVSEKFIKPLIVGVAFRAGIAKSPFAKSAGCISGFLQRCGKRVGFSLQRILPFGLPLLIPANKRVTGVLSGHQRRARRSTN